MDTAMEGSANQPRLWLDKPLLSNIVISAEIVFFVLIMILAAGSRFYDLEARVMSHDENTHVYYSWRYYRGEGHTHDPLYHGPFQFHLVALSYFMFGDNDFTARIPGALFSIATVAFVWFYRRYLGRAGAIIAAILFMISPYLLYYGRYVRNEVYAAFFGVVAIWAIFRYLESGRARYAYILTAVTALHFTTKETSFIYTAQALLFLAFYLINRLSQVTWKNPENRNRFLVALLIAFLLVGGAGAVFMMDRSPVDLSATETASPDVPGQELSQLPSSSPNALLLSLGILGALAILAAAFFLIRGYTWERLRKERSFGLIILLGTLVLPQLSPFPVRFVGWTIPTNATQVMALNTTDILRMAAFLVPMAALSVVVGVIWNRREWLINAAIFYAIFTVFYTSIFTNGAGFFTGLVGSLGYWLEQQGVQRGSQPIYYYWLVQIPVYEYLPALGVMLAALIAFVHKLRPAKKGTGVIMHIQDEDHLVEAVGVNGDDEAVPVIGLLLFFTVTSLIAYSIAGEKMPWLTVHIATPMILTAGWGLGKLIESIEWDAYRKRRGWLILLLLPVFLTSLLSALGTLLGANPPFAGKNLEHLQATSTFLVSLITAVASGVSLYYLVKKWGPIQFMRVAVLFMFGFLALLTARSAILATYINYDNANELLVYAHSAPGVKTALAQIEEISRRTTDGLELAVAYDNETSYPYWWYLRNYTNAHFFGSDPTRSLREKPVILVGDANYGKIEPVVGQAYNQFEYIRLWWPNQDYFGLTWKKIVDALLDPQMRAAIFQIWLNRDYTLYGELIGRDMSLPNWSPAASMRLYIRKDIIGQLWNYGVTPTAEIIEADPFENRQVDLYADKVIGAPGEGDGQFQRPRDLEVAADGTIYLVDTDNNRIQHLDTNGTVLHIWGGFADAAVGEAPGGTFNQPWGIGVGPDGSVYVADTWNHRIQKFNPEGKFLKTWGYFGQAEQPYALWGPRDVAVNSDGHVFVTDTGNKRVVVYDSDGEFITEFGGTGMALGSFDEPVGIAVDRLGHVFIADTWNQRIQAFSLAEDGNYYALHAWDVTAWYGQSLDNKPYIAVDNSGKVFAADPEGYRVLVFSDAGDPVLFWGDFGIEKNKFGMPISVAVDLDGRVWVSDTGNSRIMRFSLEMPVEEIQ